MQVWSGLRFGILGNNGVVLFKRMGVESVIGRYRYRVKHVVVGGHKGLRADVVECCDVREVC